MNRSSAAAIAAALERFMRETAPRRSASRAEPLDPWRRAAILEGVARADFAFPGWQR
jgi:hypothetical protein